MTEDEQVEEVARRVLSISPADRLRLAAELLEAKRPDLAYAVLDRVRDELAAVMAYVRLHGKE